MEIFSSLPGRVQSIYLTSQLRELYRMINMLSKLERALILLWLEERSHQEIADILGISKNYVAVKLYRIKENLKNMSNS